MALLIAKLIPHQHPLLVLHISALVMRDLTLRSAASFGSFHLLRLLYDEFLFFVIEHCIAKAIGCPSIAVMGEYLYCGQPEELTDMLDSTLSCDKNENQSNELITKKESSQDCEPSTISQD
ncbi:transcription factor RFX3 [Caerostris extrusa]|uniref:Transcription factor RFX3 n=1 Tax=Caerostris extrusa TaxID=172846 RepID=A0AAV4QDU7_CAEEX|nr:transcription factor RFX3 [Caerostris extrusa]